MLTAIGNFCICSIAVGMIVEIIVMYPIQHRAYRPGIDNLLVLLIGGIPIAMPTVLSVTMAIGSHRLSQQVGPVPWWLNNFLFGIHNLAVPLIGYIPVAMLTALL